ncbi:hypothetical protein PRIPAC_95510, partial [Pristionchus pacificus]|uniref:Uncharacterized protein n=1 Tax=Pristionchus pacificus TaxID=54126 RepID=A0A2A6BCR8_PRIPA
MDILPKDVNMIEESTQLKKTGEESNPQQLPSNITAKLQSFQLDGDASGEELQSRIDSLEAKNLELASENGRLKERIDLQIAEMIKIDERNTEDEADARKWRAFTYSSRFIGYSNDERSTFLHDRNHGGAGDMGGQVVDQYQTGVGSGFSHVNGGGSSTGGGNVMGRSIGLLANSLPRMNRYSGRKEDWDDFETGFTIRYGMMENTVAMSLLKDNLNGAARDALRSAPDEEKLKGIKSVLKWLRSRLSNETPFEELEVEKMLRHQKVDGKSVGRVCEELEEWTSKLHRGDEAKKETARKRQLTILYEGKHTEHVRLLTLFGEGASYSKMKSALDKNRCDLIDATDLRMSTRTSRCRGGGCIGNVNMIEESTQLKKTGEESNPQQLPSVSGTQTRANAEKERKDALELKDRLKEEYDEITKAYKECKEKVKGIGSMRGHLTDLSDCFKKAKIQADKSWESILLVVNKALESDVNKGKEREFLIRLELNSLEEVEKAMTENREKVAVMRQMLSTMEEIEGVNNIPDLLRKVNTERENVTIERQGWQKMSEQLDELKGAMNLEENERMVDKWKAINDEFQNITAKLQSFQLDGDASGEELQSRIDSLEAKNLELASENGRLKERIDLQIAEMIKIDERNTEDEADARKWRAFTYSSRFIGYSNDERSTFLHDRNHGGAGDMGGQVVDQYQTGVGSGFSHVNGGGSSTGGGNVMGRSIGLLANSLPRMNRYSGRKEDWDDFETGFTIRYGMMENTVAMSLLKDNLNGAARDALRSAPDEEKLKGIKSVLKWLRSRLSNETPFEELEVEKMLRHQKVDGKSVGRVCEELEEWTSKLHR